MPSTTKYDLKDGSTLTITITDPVVVVPPVDPTPPVTGVVSLANASLSSDRLTATVNGFVIKAKGQYTGGLNINAQKLTAPGTYKDTLVISRVDGAAFTLSSVKLLGSTIPVEVYGTAGKVVIPSGPSVSIDLPLPTDDFGKSYTLKTGSGSPTFVSLAVADGVPVNPNPPTPVTSRMNGGISDGSSASVHAPFFKSVGLNSIRIWVSFDQNTGQLNGGDAKIASINDYFNLGITPRIVFTPNTDLTAEPGIPQAAINSLIAKLDKRVQINLINEPNLDQYWPGGQSKGAWINAFKWADQVAGQLRAAGFKTGSPSFTGWVESWESWWDQIIAKGYHKNFDVLAFHTYPNASAETDRANWLNLFQSMNALARKIANKVAANLGRQIKVDIDEWGFGKFVSEATAAALMPAVQASLNKDTDASAYFIVGRSGSDANPKHPHDDFPWLIDFKINQRRETLIAAFIAASKL